MAGTRPYAWGLRFDRPPCAQGETFSFLEGTWDKIDYYSYWSSTQQPCAGGGPVDILHTLVLDAGQSYRFTFRGPGKFDQRVSFKVEKDKISVLLIKKIVAQ